MEEEGGGGLRVEDDDFVLPTTHDRT
jgi:hypothetical protein